MTEKGNGDDGNLISAAQLAEARLEKLRQQTKDAREELRKNTAELAKQDSTGELIPYRHFAKAQLKEEYHSLAERLQRVEAEREKILNQMIQWVTDLREIPEYIRELDETGVAEDEVAKFRPKFVDHYEGVLKSISEWPELIRGFDRVIQDISQLRQKAQDALDDFPKQ